MSSPISDGAEPRVVIGVPLFAPGAALADALAGLLGQTYGAYRVVLVDDASGDAATQAVLERAAQDPRVSVRRNAGRLGLAANWRETFRVARELHPGAELFAWAGHHDAWDPHWLAALVARLDANPRAVLAYPLDARMDADGTRNDEGTAPFDTAGEPDLRRRLAGTARDACSGSAIYGLVRVTALERAGVFDQVLRPDRLMLAKLAVLGEFEQEPRVLWRRRMTGAPTNRRQRAASFPQGVPPAARLPDALTHGPALARWLARPEGGGLRPLQAATLTGAYLARVVARDARQVVEDRLFALEGRLPRGIGARARGLLGMTPRR
jgi:hypothetical protein